MREGAVEMRPAAEVLSYDDDGNLTGDWRWTYVWDRENRLMSMTTTSTAVAAGAPNLLLDYAYDGFGRRVKKQVWKRIGTNWVLEEELRFVYEGWNLLAEVSTLKPGAAAMFRQNPISLTALGVQPLRTYLWGEDLSGTETGAGGVGGLLLVRQHAAAVGESRTGWQVPCLDGNGNVLAYLDADSGEVMSRFEYDPFGRTVVAETVARYSKKGTGAAKRVPVEAPPFRFSTKYEDGETGLVYYGYRYYAPEWGRWVSRDPIAESGGINLYGMVGNDAMNLWDYLGFAPDTEYGSLEMLVKDVRSEIVGKSDWADREYGTTVWILVPKGSWSLSSGFGSSAAVADWKYAYGPIKKGTVIDRGRLTGGGASVDDHSELSRALKDKYCVLPLGTVHSHPHNGDPDGDMKKFQDSGGKEGRPPFSGGGFDGTRIGDIDKFNRQQYPYRNSHQMMFLLITGPEGRVWTYKPNPKQSDREPDVSPSLFGGGWK